MKIKMSNLKKVKVTFNNERKHIYCEDDEQKPNIDPMQTKIISSKYFMESLD